MANISAVMTAMAPSLLPSTIGVSRFTAAKEQTPTHSRRINRRPLRVVSMNARITMIARQPSL
ncbi:unnamed protein product [Penicillium salamii]|nr:unnamed protein product [Penicillium salamii]CAG8300867.1 unnamed protein product [Penicillium salamii]CAG8377374.1 unnamed protein product [Penicillium salamii]